MMTHAETLAHLREDHDLEGTAIAHRDAFALHSSLHLENEWQHRHPIFGGASAGEEFMERAVYPPQPRIDGVRKKVSLRIVWLDGHQESVPAEPGWRIDAQRGLLIVGRGIPRMEIPLVGVRWYTIEHPEEKS